MAEHVLNTTQTRRGMLGRMAAAVPLTAVAGTSAATSAAAADPHPGWAAEATARQRWIDEEMPDDTPEEESAPFHDEVYALWDKIAATPASTAAGAAAQVRLALRCHEEGSCLGACEELALRNALATLDRLADEGRA